MKNRIGIENVWLRPLCQKSWLPECFRCRSLKLFCSLITQDRRAEKPNLHGKKGRGSGVEDGPVPQERGIYAASPLESTRASSSLALGPSGFLSLDNAANWAQGTFERYV
ncbi:MAG: hypothetical protein C5B50_27805 [Verrucomicrobia bacterium]|nr:MAG: hypothetical protein C5B50_27805 [Verrucomicrobiota bacterium]